VIKSSNVKITGAEYGLILVVLLLVLMGLLAIYSVSYQVELPVLKANFTRQILWFFISVVILVFAVIIPTRAYQASAFWLYFITIIFLILTLVLNQGSSVTRWITIGPMRFQPSEFAKIGVILALARYLSHEKRNLNKLKDIAISFGIVLLPFLLVAKQPDLGTALVFLAVILPVLFWAGMPSFFLLLIVAPLIVMIASLNYYTYFLAMILIAVALLFFKRGLFSSILIMILNIVVGIVTPILWNHLHEYQKHRILTFLGIEMDPHGLGYQVIQSKVAIGSGGFWGKGILKGTQTQLRFLPEQHTDFVFSVIGEELGFIGSLFVMILFLILLLRGIYIASKVRNKFSSLMVIGAIAILGFHIIVNIGMTVGVMPVTGLPLPFLSYGGSFLIVCMILTGIIINASIRRFKY
jgi:rod shape determining protein RodA